jgi:PAS domain S-box-containing protein
MAFEALGVSADERVREARALVLAFWSALAESSPDLGKLAATGAAISAQLAASEACFKELIELAPSSSSVLRKWAEFLLELGNDPVRAREMLADAELIEDEATRSRGLERNADLLFAGLLKSFDLTAESVAWIRVSSAEGSLGIVTAANASALTLCGYHRRELIGKDVNTLVPEPIGSVHGHLLSRFMRDGVERVVNSSRVMFAQHAAGNLFPVRINVRPTGQDWVAVCESVSTSLGFLWALGAAHDFRVVAASASSLSTFRIDVAAVKAGSVTLRALVADGDAASLLASLLDDEAASSGGGGGSSFTLAGVRVVGRLQCHAVSFCPGKAMYTHSHLFNPTLSPPHLPPSPRQ